MKKILKLYLFIGFFSNLWGYDALVSAVTSKSSSLQIIHEGNNKDELKKNINKVFFSIKIKSSIKLRDKNGKTINDIDIQRKFVDGVITWLKDIINVVNLLDMRVDINNQSVKKIVIESIKTFDNSLKKFGITLSVDAHQKFVDTVVTVILETVSEGGNLGKTIDPKLFGRKIAGKIFFITDKILDLASIANDIIATVRMNNFLFYNQVDGLADTFIHKYLDSVLYKYKPISLDFFLNNFYYYNMKYYDFNSFIKETGRHPTFGDKVISHIKMENDILKSLNYECSTTLECMQKYSGMLVGAPIDIISNSYEDFIGIDNFKKRLQERIDIKLKQFGLHQRLLFYMKITDNFETNSKRGTTLTTKYIHNISDLSSVKVYAISNKNQKLDIYPYCGTTSENFGNKILAQEKTAIFYKTNNCRSDNGSYNKLAISFNKKLYHLIDYFKLEKRYLNIKDEIKDNSFYGRIRNLKMHGIKLDDNRHMSTIVTNKQALELLFKLNAYLANKNQKYNYGYNGLKITGEVTYSKIFSKIHILLKHYYGNNYNILKYSEESEDIYPRYYRAIHTKKYIRGLRKSVIRSNFNAYRAYLSKLSRSGIIKIELSNVSKNLDEPISFRKFILYLNRIIDYSITQGS